VPPAGTGEQVPTLPVRAHDRQFPLQSLSQQTPCEQKLELHSLPVLQITPVGFLPHVSVLWQVFGDEQSAAWVATVQEALQADTPSHRNGSHGLVVTALQCPTPSQRRCCVKVEEPLGQTGAAHTVVAGYR